MNPKHVFAALGILLAILSFVPFFHGGAVEFVAGGVISIGVAVILPPS